MNTVTFSGSKAELLDLIGIVERSTLTLEHNASFNIRKFEKRCPLCKIGNLSSFCNLEQHIANKHGKTFDAVAGLDFQAAQAATSEEIISHLESMVRALRSNQ